VPWLGIRYAGSSRPTTRLGGKLDDDDDRVIELQQVQVAVGIDQHGASMPPPEKP
jgi:hypothetical protein